MSNKNLEYPKPDILFSCRQPWAQMIVGGVIKELPYDEKYAVPGTRIFILAAGPKPRYWPHDFDYPNTFIQIEVFQAVNHELIPRLDDLAFNRIVGYVDVVGASKSAKSVWAGIEDLDSIGRIYVENAHYFPPTFEIEALTPFNSYLESPIPFDEYQLKAALPAKKFERSGKLLSIPNDDFNFEFYIRPDNTLPIRMTLLGDDVERLLCYKKDGDLVPYETTLIRMVYRSNEAIFKVRDIEIEEFKNNDGSFKYIVDGNGREFIMRQVVYYVEPAINVIHHLGRCIADESELIE